MREKWGKKVIGKNQQFDLKRLFWVRKDYCNWFTLTREMVWMALTCCKGLNTASPVQILQNPQPRFPAIPVFVADLESLQQLKRVSQHATDQTWKKSACGGQIPLLLDPNPGFQKQLGALTNRPEEDREAHVIQIQRNKPGKEAFVDCLVDLSREGFLPEKDRRLVLQREGDKNANRFRQNRGNHRCGVQAKVVSLFGLNEILYSWED